MSKYEELVNTYHKAQQYFIEYRNSCLDFANAFWTKMMDYFEVPENLRVLYFVDEEGEFEMVPPKMANALDLRDDSYYQVGIGITLKQGDTSRAQETIQMALLFKKVGDDFHVRLSDEENDHIISPDDDRSMKAYFDFLFNIIMQSYQSGLQEFDTDKEGVKKIGFDFKQKRSNERN